MRWRWGIVGLCLWTSLALWAQEKKVFTIMSYNVENYFDYQHDTLKQDWEFTAEGNRHWTYTKMQRKAEKIAKVIAVAGGWKNPAIVGLCEVENAKCLQLLCRKMPNFPYQYVHFESPDERGVDVALLYDSTQFVVQHTEALYVNLNQDRAGEEKDYTRDVLYVRGATEEGDTLHVFMCHLPSMLGGKEASEWKRQRAKDVIRQKVKSVLKQDENAKIVVMGDMNCSPKDDLAGLHNQMLHVEKKGLGTEKYQGHWSCLDQIYLSASLEKNCQTEIFDAEWLQERDEKHLGLRPKRTFNGWKYQHDGYSDHLPIVVKWERD